MTWWSDIRRISFISNSLQLSTEYSKDWVAMALLWGGFPFVQMLGKRELLLLRDIAPLLTICLSCEEVHLFKKHLSNQFTLAKSSQLYPGTLFGQNVL